MDNLCIECNKFPIKNSWHKLCAFCNEKRLEKNKPEKKKKKPKRKKDFLLDVKKDFRERKIHENEYKCSGCGGLGTRVFLSVSHIIPISLNRNLREDPENFVLDCMPCHEVWEHDQRKSKKFLLNYEQRMSYIEKVDINYYHRLRDKE